MKCRNCGSPVDIEMVDLGMAPLCQEFLTAEQLDQPEVFLPLKVKVCGECLLAQLDEFASPAEIFGEYAYFSSFSESWLEHARRYVVGAIESFGLGPQSLVVEIASNDGYLLRWLVEEGVPVLGVEPAANVAEAAVQAGIPTEVAFFGTAFARDLRRRRGPADLIVGNNVFAHVPDLHDFVGGLAELVADDGVITLEFPHLLRLLVEGQFDTIYHEHFSYLSLTTCVDIFGRRGLEVFDVDQLPTHGGSLRLYVHRAGHPSHPVTDAVPRLLQAEADAGLLDTETYRRFGDLAREVKHGLLATLIEMKQRGETIAAYGAAGKGNTLLNYCGIRSDFLEFIADRNPYKIGRYSPGTHLPVVEPAEIERLRPDHILILPWNLETEIVTQLSFVEEWGGDFIVPIPRVRIVKPGAGR